MTAARGLRRAFVVAVLLVLPLLVSMTNAASPLTLAHTGGGVVFTFNDGYASGPTVASILEAHGFRGTFYSTSSFLRQGPYYTAYMAASDLANLSAKGHDIESMTVDQADLTTLTASQLEAELVNSQTSLQAITGKPVQQLAYPYGAVNTAVATATASHYASGRTVTTNVNDFTSSVDPYHLPGLMVLRSTSLAAAESYVDFATSHNVVIVLSFENIVTNPNTYDWTPTMLDSLAGYAQSKGMLVETVARLVAGTPPPPSPAGVPSGAHVVFTFDDGYTSQLPAAQTLANHGFRGTFFIISDCVNGETGGPCMTNSDIVGLSNAGHDIEAHTVTHPDLTTLSSSELTHQLADSQTTLAALTGKPMHHTAYPYGAHDPTVRAATANYYLTGRIYLTNPAPSNLPTLLAQSGTNPYVLPGIGVARATSLATAKQYVDYAISHNTTIVLVFHDLLNRGGDAYTWTPTSFNSLVDYVASAHVDVETMSQLYG